MVTRVTTPNSNDNILDEHFHRIAEKHVQYKIRQDHVDVSNTKYELHINVSKKTF